MPRLPHALIAAIVAAALALPVAAQPGPDTAPAAIVARLRGSAVVDGAPSPRPLRLFDRLVPGDVVRTGSGSEIVLVFRTGTRARVTANSRARLEDARAVRLAGAVEALPAVPTVPLVAPVAGAGRTITAVRIRATALKLFGPPPGAMTLADDTRLEFEPVAGSRYEIEILDTAGALVYRAEVSTSRFTVPPTALAPGVSYEWKVTARLPTGFTSAGESRFRTLGAEAVHARENLRSALAGERDAASLLAEVDRSLGLWREALDGFRAARAAGVEDVVIGERIADLERRLAAGVDPKDNRH
ncbi:MAG: hypothetical protein R2708_08190 [Vicinamibacterales bacterium]